MLKKQSKKTKKLIICLVFVVATGTITNANSNNNGIYIDCYVDCDNYAKETRLLALNSGFSFEKSLEISYNAYGDCVDYNIENLEEIEEEEEIEDDI